MDRERRTSPRVSLNAEVRIRAAGSSGRGIPCRVRDAGPWGVRFHADESIGADWHWVEILKASGQSPAERLEARVVHAGTDEHGRTRVGCSFD